MNPKQFTVQIHGKDYLTVDGRLVRLHEDYHGKPLNIRTECLNVVADKVLFKATVTTEQGAFDGHSAAKVGGGGIEGTNPFEVAETSAVGRALKHAGILVEYGPTVEEMQKSEREMGAAKTAPQVEEDFTQYSLGTESDMTEAEADQQLLATKITFGQYTGKTFGDIINTDSRYIEWLSKNAKTPAIRKAADAVVKRGIDIFRGGSAE